MKKITLIILLIVGTFTSYGQGNLPEGGKRLNAGFGFSTFGAPVYLGLDFGVHPDITIGPQISYRRYNQRFNSLKYYQSLTVLSLNGDYHFNSVLDLQKEIDLYAGASFGYYIWSDINSNDPLLNNANVRGSGVGIGLHVGGRYFFSSNLALNIELGAGTASGGKIGITYQF